MFNNIGSKCKTVAVVIMVLGTLGAIVGGFTLIDGGEGMALAGLVIIVVGIISSWVSALSFFALGEIAETVERIEQNTRPEKGERNIVDSAKKPVEQSGVTDLIHANYLSDAGKLAPEAEHLIYCPSCGIKNKAGSKKCWSCDNPLG